MNEEPIVNKIIRSKRRTLSIEVHPPGQVVVRAPARASERDIQQFIHEKSPWIKKALGKVKARAEKKVQKQFVNDESFLFLGHPYPLRIVAENHNPLVFDDFFKITRAAKPQAKALFTTWYQQKAREILPQRLAHFAARMSVSYQRVRLSNATKRWGSCSAKGYINLNWRLIMAPLAVIDYVVVHELAHLKEMNHSPRFWQWVQTILPDYTEQRVWLRRFGDDLVV